MKTTKNRTQRQPITGHQEISKLLEEIKMKLHITTSTMKIRVSKVLASKAPVIVLGGLALAAMLMTATALPLSPVHADEATRPITNISYEQQIRDLHAMESTFTSPAKVVRSSYDQQLADLNS